MINTDVFEKVMHEELSKIEDSDSAQAVSDAMSKAGFEFVKTFPVWMRCNYLLNQLTKISEKDINWDRVNEVLQAQNKELDYNCFDEISSLQELVQLRENANIAEVPEFNQPYFRKKCKMCDDEFTLTRREINYFLDKGLKVPNRCYCCRKNIKTPRISMPVHTEDLPTKTAMQIAMEKAGIH